LLTKASRPWVNGISRKKARDALPGPVALVPTEKQSAAPFCVRHSTFLPKTHTFTGRVGPAIRAGDLADGGVGLVGDVEVVDVLLDDAAAAVEPDFPPPGVRGLSRAAWLAGHVRPV
jgi:hypothetical protein